MGDVAQPDFVTPFLIPATRPVRAQQGTRRYLNSGSVQFDGASNVKSRIARVTCLIVVTLYARDSAAPDEEPEGIQTAENFEVKAELKYMSAHYKAESTEDEEK